MYLVDEEDRPFLLEHLVNYPLDPFLEIAPVLGSRHQGAHIQGVDRKIPQSRGHQAGNDALSQSLGHGGLADAGIADMEGLFLSLRQRTCTVRSIRGPGR
jgi:hypothetical protein